MNSRVAGERCALRRVMKANVSYSGGSNGTPAERAARARASAMIARGATVSPSPRAARSSAAVDVLDLDLRLELHAGALGALAELAARRVVGAPAGVVEDQRRRRRAARCVIGSRGRARLGADVEELLLHGRAHVEAAVVDRQRDQAGLELAVAHGVGHLGGVLADDAHADVGWRARKSCDQVAEQVVVGAAERAEGDGPAREVAHLAHRLGGLARGGQRALGVRAQQPARLGQLEPPAGAREQRHAELGLEPADLLRQARLGHVQRLGGGGERAVLDRGEEVRELLESQ